MPIEDTAPTSTGTRPRPIQAAHWILALSLAAIAINLTFRGNEPWPAALAQPVRSAGARGIFAFSGQLTPTSFGLFMVDVDEGTLWCYEYGGSGTTRKLRLVSARSWLFDRYLENFQCEGLSPKEVRDLVEGQRSVGDVPGQGNNP